MDGNAAKPFQVEKIFLNQMAFLVQPPVAMTLKFRSFFGRNGWFPAIFINIINQFVVVISTVGHYLASFHINMFQYGDCIIDAITLPLAQHDIYRITISIYSCMDLGLVLAPLWLCPISFGAPPFFCFIFVFYLNPLSQEDKKGVG